MLVVVSWPEMTTPNTASQKYSNEPNLSARSDSNGARATSRTMPTSVPMVEPVVATLMA